MTEAVHRCARGDRCYAWDRGPTGSDGQPTRLGAVCDRPLCDVCTAAVARALDDAPQLYVQVRLKTLDRDITDRGPQVSISRGSPLPLHGRALDLGEQLADLLTRGEDQVRAVARLTAAQRGGKREGRQVVDACRVLAGHLTAWISLDPAQPIALLDWRATVRRLPGVDVTAAKAVRRYEQRCPACGVRAITHRAGDDLMHCQSCGATQPYLPTLPREADYRDQESA